MDTGEEVLEREEQAGRPTVSEVTIAAWRGRGGWRLILIKLFFHSGCVGLRA